MWEGGSSSHPLQHRDNSPYPLANMISYTDYGTNLHMNWFKYYTGNSMLAAKHFIMHGIR